MNTTKPAQPVTAGDNYGHRRKQNRQVLLYTAIKDIVVHDHIALLLRLVGPQNDRRCIAHQ